MVANESLSSVIVSISNLQICVSSCKSIICCKYIVLTFSGSSVSVMPLEYAIGPLSLLSIKWL